MNDSDEGRVSEVPVGPLANAPRFGSDVVADTLRALNIAYIAFNPGASCRGVGRWRFHHGCHGHMDGRALSYCDAGRVAVVDVRIEPGYSATAAFQHLAQPAGTNRGGAA